MRIQLYQVLRKSMGCNPGFHDPSAFIKEIGGWLRAEQYMADPAEHETLDTTGVVFLLNIWKKLNPVTSYKMVVLTCLLQTDRDRRTCPVSDILWRFKIHPY
jgi:hypothetical protein